jgi:uncharacterized phage protein (TIGR02218 family)
MSGASGLLAHLKSGHSTVANAWAVRRGDGLRLGFTDHDCALEFEGLQFLPSSGMTASALQLGNGLAVDNAEAMGVLQDARITAADIAAGRYDGAEVEIWLVNWANPAERYLRFRGHFGEIRHGDGAFHVELRGLSEALNRPVGRVYQKPCPAVLGDAACQFDLSRDGFKAVGQVVAPEAEHSFRVALEGSFEAGWFARGAFEVASGAALGLRGVIKQDAALDGRERQIGLWADLGAEVAPGDHVILVAGCDKRVETCRFKFDNLLNYQGFPDIPSEDWMLVHPARSADLTGGSRR